MGIQNTAPANSPLARLIKDANKPGAFQAKIAYLQYLIERTGSESDSQIEELLTELTLHRDLPIDYRELVFFWQAHYLDNKRGAATHLETIKRNYEEFVLSKYNYKNYPKEYNYALARLQDIYIFKYQKQDFSRYGKPEIISAASKSADYTYKDLRSLVQRQSIGIQAYQNHLIKLLKHPELTDTLEAKIYYQLLRTYLQEMSETGTKDSLKKVQETINKLVKSPHLHALHKAIRANEIQHKITNELRSVDAEPSKRFWELRDFSSNPFMDFFYKIAHFFTVVFNKEELKEQLKMQKLRSVAEEILSTSTSMDIHETFFNDNNKRAPVENQPATADDIALYGSENKQPYARVNQTTRKMTISVKTLTGKAIPIECHQHMSIYDFKGLIFKKDGAKPDWQRIIFAGRQLSDNLTLDQCNIKPESDVTLVLKLRGD